MQQYQSILLGLAIATALLSSCQRAEDTIANNDAPELPTTPYNYANVNYPAHIQAAIEALDNTPTDNVLTDEGATLGRVLFFDNNLSQNNRIACASCHNSQAGFSDDRALSRGFEGGDTRRHSMTTLNTRLYQSGKFFWDERANSLEEQALMPIQDHIEMGMELADLVEKLRGVEYYPALFADAFGSNVITEEGIAKALAQYMRSMVPYQSKYDEVQQGRASFTAEELAGQQRFARRGPNGQLSCQDCHGGGTTDIHATQVHLGQVATRSRPFDASDLGVYETTNNPNDRDKFKVGTLRNIAERAPYLHDGSAGSLQELLQRPDHNFGLTPTEIEQVVAYLETLTDLEIQRAEQYSNPFPNRRGR
jgi:cytochrome c peroxidase